MDKEVSFYVFSHSQQGLFKENFPCPPPPPFLFNQRDLTQPPVQSPLRPSFHSPKRPAFFFFCLGILTFFFVACSGTSSDKTNSTSNTTDRDTEQECSIQNGEGKKTRSVTEGEEPEEWENIECVVVTCNEGYTQNRGACHKTEQACAEEDLAKISYATAGTKLYEKSTGAYGDCVITECQDTHTLYKGTEAEQGACHKTEQACAEEDLAKISAYATAGTKLYEKSTGAYGDCAITECQNTHTFYKETGAEQGACHKTEQACAEEDLAKISAYVTAGTKLYEKSTGAYGDCVITECQDTHTFYKETGAEQGACHKTEQVCTKEDLAKVSVHATAGTKSYEKSAGAYGDCAITECQNTHTLYKGTGAEQGACYETSKACTDVQVTALDAHGLAGTKPYQAGTLGTYGNCVLTQCRTEYILDDKNDDGTETCHTSTVACTHSSELTPLHATAATKTYDANTHDYGDCIPLACDTGYTVHNDRCHKTNEACAQSGELTPLNAKTATKTYDKTLSDYRACVPTQCLDDYTLHNNTCHETTAPCTGSDLQDLQNTDPQLATAAKTYNKSQNGYGACVPTSCNNGYSLSSGMCRGSQSCDASGVDNHAKTGIKFSSSGPGGGFGPCKIESCNSGYTLHNNDCHETTVTCTNSATLTNLHATTATKTYSTSLSDYKDCVPTSSGCKTDYAFYNDACHETTVTCTDSATLTPLNADIAEKTYQVFTGDYGDCVPTSTGCKTGYTFDDDACHATTVTCTDSALLTRLHATAAEKIYSTSIGDYGDCIPTSSGCETGYTFDNNACHESEKACSSQELIALYATTGTRSYDSNANDYGVCVMGTCIAGYDDSDTDGDCEVTQAGYYSPAGSNTQTACTGNPADSSWIGTGLDSADDCEWACNGGFDNTQDPSLCETTQAGYYSPVGSSARTACTKPDDSSWTNRRGLASVDGCWTCDGGFDNTQDPSLCETTQVGYYSPAGSSARTACTGNPADSSWISGTTGLTSSAGCSSLTWACDAGFDDYDNNDTCEKTIVGYYSPDGDSTRTPCYTVTFPSEATADNTSTGLNEANQCFICNNGYYKSRNGSACIKVRLPIVAGEDHTCLLIAGGRVTCWGDDDYNQASPPGNLGTAIAIAAGSVHTCALIDDGSVTCWGSDNFASPPKNLGVATAIAVGSSHTCALIDDGSVTCWKSDGSKVSPPKNLGVATAIAVGSSHTCALIDDESVTCWGNDDEGQASPPGNLGTATAIAVGSSHTCALIDDGRVTCWGYNFDDQASPPGNLGTATAIAAGQYHTCALIDDGSVTCWGDDDEGQASPPGNLGVATAIATGGSHTCALIDDGSVTCWGNDDYGQIDTTICSISKSNGKGLRTGGGNTCTPQGCNSGYYSSDGSTCTPVVSPGYISIIGALYQTLCEGDTIANPARSACISCDLDKHTEDHANCVPNKESCEIVNGQGEKTWDRNKSAWNDCTPIRCDEGHYKPADQNACVDVSPGHISLAGALDQTPCNPDQHTEDHVHCVSNTEVCNVSNGTGRKTWNIVKGEWSDCQIVSCGTDFYKTGTSSENTEACTEVEVGEYSASNSVLKGSCNNKPSESEYTSLGGGSASGCSWACNEGHWKDSGTFCTLTPKSFYSEDKDNSKQSCNHPDKPSDNAIYTRRGETTQNCEWACDTGFVLDEGSCWESTALADIGNIEWDSLYRKKPAKAASDFSRNLLCSINGYDTDFYLEKVWLTDSSDHEERVFYDHEGTVHVKTVPGIRYITITNAVMSLLRSQRGASGGSPLSYSQRQGWISFIAPEGTGTSWNGKKIKIKVKARGSCPKMIGFAAFQGGSVDLSFSFAGGLDKEAVSISKGVLPITDCFKANGQNNSLTIDGVVISLGSANLSRLQVAQKIASADFSTGSTYATHPYKVTSNDHGEVIFTLNTASNQSVSISIEDGSYSKEACRLQSCDEDYYLSHGLCVPVGDGYYSVDSGNTSVNRVQCNHAKGGAITNGRFIGSGEGSDNCPFECDLSYHKDTNSNYTCVSNIKDCPINDGTGETFWDPLLNTGQGNWDSNCGRTGCNEDFYLDGNNGCVAVADGEYSEAGRFVKEDCTNKPLNSKYISSGSGLATGCAWACDAGYWKNSPSSCQLTSHGYWSGEKDNTKRQCNPNPVKPGNHVYTEEGEQTANCTHVLGSRSCQVANGVVSGGTEIWSVHTNQWEGCTIESCDRDYYKVGKECLAVGHGYYSVGLGTASLSRVECGSKGGTITNGQFTSSGGGSDSCSFSCNADYHSSPTDVYACEDDTVSCSISEGTGSETWSGSAFGDCEVQTCNEDHYKVGDACVAVGNGYYSVDSGQDSLKRKSCANGPYRSEYTSSGSGSATGCTWLCGAGDYKKDGGCEPTPLGEYSAAGNNDKLGCNEIPGDAVYTRLGEDTENCRWECNQGYIISDNKVCVQDSTLAGIGSALTFGIDYTPATLRWFPWTNAHRDVGRPDPDDDWPEEFNLTIFSCSEVRKDVYLKEAIALNSDGTLSKFVFYRRGSHKHPLVNTSLTIDEATKELADLINGKTGATDLINGKTGATDSTFSAQGNGREMREFIDFIAPQNTGAEWNGRKVSLIFGTDTNAPECKYSGDGDALISGTFSGGKSAYQVTTLEISECLAASATNSSITIDGVEIDLGSSALNTAGIGSAIANADFSGGTLYATHPYTVTSATDNTTGISTVSFTLSGSYTNPTQPLYIEVDDSSYTKVGCLDSSVPSPSN